MEYSKQLIVSCFALGAAVVPLAAFVRYLIESTFSRVAAPAHGAIVRTAKTLLHLAASAAVFVGLFCAGFIWQTLEPIGQDDEVAISVAFWFFVGFGTYIIGLVIARIVRR